MRDRVVRMSSESASGTKLSWVVRRGSSYRFYRHAADRRSFCVSTRSTEVAVVLEGEMRLAVGPKRQELVLRPGDVGVVARGTPHTSSYGVGSAIVIFDVDAASVDAPRIARAASDVARPLVALAERLVRHDLAIVAREVADVAAKASLRLEQAVDVEHVQSTRLMQRVRESLERTYFDGLSLEATARAHHIDPFYLSRAFKRNFGVPPQSYVQFLRTEHFVWESLRAARHSPNLGRVAGEAGFGDYATFSRRMRALFGKPPSALFERL